MRVQIIWLLGLFVFTGCGGGEEAKSTATGTSAAPVAQDSPAGDEPQVPAADAARPPEPTALASDSALHEQPGEGQPAPSERPEPGAATPAPAATGVGVDGAAAARATGETTDLSYIDSKFVAGVVAHPRQILESKFGKAFVAGVLRPEDYEEAAANLEEAFGVRPESIDQAAVLMTEDTIARSAGIPLDDGAGNAASEVALKLQLKNIALAFHNYHDAYNKFPDANDHVSWRVRILPFLEEAELHQQFDLDQPWDGEQNKKLIAKMPDIFRAPGVDEPGKTSIHVFVGKDAPFDGEVGLRSVIDGTSNTVLVAVAGPDKAVEWTRPGGLKIDKENPIRAFGKIQGDAVPVAMMDGSVTRIPKDADPATVIGMLTHAGGEIVPVDAIRNGARGPDPRQNPTLVVHCNRSIDQQKAVTTLTQGFGEAVEKTGNGQPYFDAGGYAVWFPDDKTLVATQAELLPRLMANRGDDSKLRKMISKHAGADVLACADTAGMPEVFKALLEQAPVPPNVREIVAANLVLDVSSTSHPLALAVVSVSNEQSAAGLFAMLNGSIMMMQQQLNPANAPPEAAAVLEVVQGLLKDTKLVQDGSDLVYRVPKPDDYDKFVTGLDPLFRQLGEAVQGARGAAERMSRMNNMKQIGLAFHNHHDVYNTFGAADGSTGDGGRKSGLSWRVHLLPFMEEAELYSRFKLDEPWDSEHNKALIAEMPEVFKVPGVDEPGKTSIHVIVGKGAPFGDGMTPLRIRDITDGTSNTILAVVAGADTADVWTKPGGLTLNQDDPIRTLGKVGETIIALFADGSVQNISRDVDATVLRRLLMHRDGEPVDF